MQQRCAQLWKTKCLDRLNKKFGVSFLEGALKRHPEIGGRSRGSIKPSKRFDQHQPKGNNCNRNGHLMQHLHSAWVVRLLLAAVGKGALDVASRAPRDEAEVVVVALLMFFIDRTPPKVLSTATRGSIKPPFHHRKGSMEPQ